MSNSAVPVSSYSSFLPSGLGQYVMYAGVALLAYLLFEHYTMKDHIRVLTQAVSMHNKHLFSKQDSQEEPQHQMNSSPSYETMSMSQPRSMPMPMNMSSTPQPVGESPGQLNPLSRSMPVGVQMGSRLPADMNSNSNGNSNFYRQ